MTAYAQPPQPLEVAIGNAARQYHVPPDVLEGIWRVESGSSYPNPYRNSLGYGGLFGTQDWNGPVQEQADLAASILAKQLQVHNGNLSEALSSYSGGGYTSVPGETTFGSVNVGSNTILTPPTTVVNPAASQQGTVSDASLSSIVTAPLNFFGSAFNGIFGFVKTPFEFLGTLWKVLTSRNFWIRVLLVVGGFVVIVIGIKAVVS